MYSQERVRGLRLARKPKLGRAVEQHRILLSQAQRGLATIRIAPATRSDFFVINTAMHAVVSMTRVINERGAGSKVCGGLFLTDQELRDRATENP
jgi:hypothetical protein